MAGFFVITGETEHGKVYYMNKEAPHEWNTDITNGLFEYPTVLDINALIKRGMKTSMYYNDGAPSNVTKIRCVEYKLSEIKEIVGKKEVDEILYALAVSKLTANELRVLGLTDEAVNKRLSSD